MKHLLITTIAAVLLVGCGESQQQSAPKSKSTTTKAPDISIHTAAYKGNIEAVKQHLDAGADVNARVIENGLLCIMRLTVVKRKSLNYSSTQARM